VSLWIAVLCGGLGGSVRGLLAVYRDIVAWLQARRELHQKRRRGRRPRFSHATDWPAELIGMAVQITIGALVSGFLTYAGTVSGFAGAVLAGVSAPAILAQLSQVRLTYRLAAEDGEPIVLTAGTDTEDDTEPKGAKHGG